ncbi:MAG: carboxyl transferase domain-containing protein [Candidatus Neomarinimicrobiota bacterium]
MANNDHFYLPFEKKGKERLNSKTIQSLSEYEKYQLSFHPERPKFCDYLSLFSKVEPCLQSSEFGACLIQTYRASLGISQTEIDIMLIGQQSGPASNYKELRLAMEDNEVLHKWNHGMPNPTSYRRAIEAVKLANQENRLIIVFVDTPGADPTEESEAQGIAWAIGGTIKALIESTTPTMSIIINRACSGGAIALTGTDVTLALEFSTYLVITPEACSSILFHDRFHADEAAAASQITSREGLKLGIVDELIPEAAGPAHRFPVETKKAVKLVITKHAEYLNSIRAEDIFDERIKRWAKIGKWDEGDLSADRSLRKKVSRLPQAESGYIKHHQACYSEDGKRIYDPVSIKKLHQFNFVCHICGHRYLRPSAWDYINLILDKDSFREHPETEVILDKDILGFPGYAEKLARTRQETGLNTAMITGNGKILGQAVVFCATDFGFFGGSFCMSTGEKIWRAAEIAIKNGIALVLQAAGGGARMHAGCSSMVSIPKAHVALTKVERAGLPLVTIITDPTLGGVAIGYGSRGIRLFEDRAGNIGFSGKRVIEQYTGNKVSRDFQTTAWLVKHKHAEIVVNRENIKEIIHGII